jgi:hypothetical protein
MIKKIFLLFFLNAQLSASFSEPGQNVPLTEWKHNQNILEQLQKTKIRLQIPMHEYLPLNGKSSRFTSTVFLVELENGMSAVFKPDEEGDSYFEEVAYQLSCYLGFPYIPPTVIRTINGVSGSLQLFVNADSQGADQEMLTRVDEDDFNRLKVFCFIFGQWDAYKDNLLLMEDKSTHKVYPIAIDNNMIKMIQKVRYGESPYVALRYSKKINSHDFDRSFPFEQAVLIEDLSKENIKKIFSVSMPIGFIEYFPYHCEKYKYVFYQNYLWRQFDLDGQSISFVEKCSLETYSVLKSINLSDLKSIYAKAMPYIFKGKLYAKENESFIQEYFDDILDRRDQVIKYLERVV